MSACGSSASPLHGGTLPPGTKDAGADSAVTPAHGRATQPQVIDQVVSGWLAAEGAFADAARTSDPFEPELAATTLAPQLGWTRSLLEKMSADGLMATGPVRLRDAPRHRAARRLRPPFEHVRWTRRSSCRTRQAGRSPECSGQVAFELFTSKMRADGRWMEVGVPAGRRRPMRSSVRILVVLASFGAGLLGCPNCGVGGGGRRRSTAWNSHRRSLSGRIGRRQIREAGRGSKAGRGDARVPWQCVYTELLLNDEGGNRPRRPHSRELVLGDLHRSGDRREHHPDRMDSGSSGGRHAGGQSVCARSAGRELAPPAFVRPPFQSTRMSQS